MQSEEIKSWKSFINRSVKVKINGKEFPAVFYEKEEKLYLSITMTGDIEEWRKTENDFECLSAELPNSKKITLLNCRYFGSGASGDNPITNAHVDYFIDRLIVGYDLKDITLNFIKCISFNFDNIEWITKSRVYKNDILKGKIDITCLYKEYKLPDKTVTFGMLPSFECEDYKIIVSGERGFSVSFNSDKTIDEALRYVYTIKNLLMLLGKRNINIVDKKIIEGDYLYDIIDCGLDRCYHHINKSLLIHLNHISNINIENLSNFDKILYEFENKYERLMPLIELYFNVVKYMIPDLTRFVNSLTMLEYYSREFDDANALKITITKRGKKPKNGAEFADRVESLIKNVNDVFNMNNADIEVLAKKIKDARTYYIHYDHTGKKINDDILFKYVYFIEDIILLNIYLMLGLEIKSIENISFDGFYYNVSELLKS